MQPPAHLWSHICSLRCLGIRSPVFLALCALLAPEPGEGHCCSALPGGSWWHLLLQLHLNVSLYCQSSVTRFLMKHLPLLCRSFHVACLCPGPPVFPGGQDYLLHCPFYHGPAWLWGTKFADLHLVSAQQTETLPFALPPLSRGQVIIILEMLYTGMGRDSPSPKPSSSWNLSEMPSLVFPGSASDTSASWLTCSSTVGLVKSDGVVSPPSAVGDLLTKESSSGSQEVSGHLLVT